MRETLTKKMLEEMPPETMFATGLAMDCENELFMANTKKELRWVAIRGEIPDWAIYCHFSTHDEGWVRRHGDKVCMESHIKMLVPCENSAFKMYRY